jgi:hypothetical protein
VLTTEGVGLQPPADLGAALAGGVRAGATGRAKRCRREKGMMAKCPRIASKRTQVTGLLRPGRVPTTFHGYWYGFRRCVAQKLGRDRGDLSYTTRCRAAKMEIPAQSSPNPIANNGVLRRELFLALRAMSAKTVYPKAYSSRLKICPGSPYVIVAKVIIQGLVLTSPNCPSRCSLVTPSPRDSL